MKTISALGLDVGRKRIGVAGCDRLGLLATGITTLDAKSMRSVIDELQRLIAEREVEILVIGLPYTMDGNIGTQAKRTQQFAETASRILKLPVEYIDERLTSYEAEQQLQAANISVSWNKGKVDQKAAELILQQWLDERREKVPISRDTFQQNESQIKNESR
jgi:putative holliday junction resolvase